MAAFELDPPQRVLLGPGPSEVPATVLEALARPTVGYLDETYVALMEDVQAKLRRLFVTTNDATFAVTGSGTAAMECAITNCIEPGDRAVACVHGYFGDRMRQILERCGAVVTTVAAPWGQQTDPAALERALQRDSARVITAVHGETSTGVRQEIAPLADLARQHDALLIVDTVASLGGVPFDTDRLGADVVYTGAQKCLSVPPGISPITFGPRALALIEGRRAPCPSWYLDAKLNLTYWNRPHAYHHTGPINLTYALYEGLRLALDVEGLDARFARTDRTARGLWAGLEALGLSLFVAPESRLATLTTVLAPDGVDEAAVRGKLMGEHGIEIAGGLGALKGRAWRVGLMGASCTEANVQTLLAALAAILTECGHACEAGAATEAAGRVFDEFT